MICIKLCLFYFKKLGPNIYKIISVQQFDNDTFINSHFQLITTSSSLFTMSLIKRPARDACLCMGELPAPPAPAAPPAPPAPHFVFLITL